jgi:hypothetical protein
MRIDFWNNPIIVSAFRVKNRRGGLFNLSALYIMVLVAGGMVLQYYNDRIGGIWSRNYLLCLIGVQFFVSAMIAASTTAASLRTEVTSRTLDFQRIATLSPRQILLGKLLGEPAVAYMLVFATVPLMAWCWMLGVPGVTITVLLLIYVNLTTTTILFGSLGLLQRLDASPGRSSGASGGVVAVWLLMPFAMVPTMFANPMLLTRPWTLAPIGLFTPLPVFEGIREGDPWHFCLIFYGLQLPFLLVTPAAQLVTAFIYFKVLERRLINPLNPSLGKGFAYVTLFWIDLIMGGVLMQHTPLGLDLSRRLTTFALVHVAATFCLVSMVTPWRESLESWVWRLRGRQPLLKDLLIGTRSENGLALVVCALIGLTMALAAVIVPFGLQEGFDWVGAEQGVVIATLLVPPLLIVSLGTLFQLLAALLSGRTGLTTLFLTILLVLLVPPHVLGYYYQIDWLSALSASAHVVSWSNNTAAPSLWQLVGLYIAIFIFSWVGLRRWMSYLGQTVDRKLQSMGVRVVPSDAKMKRQLV